LPRALFPRLLELRAGAKQTIFLPRALFKRVLEMLLELVFSSI
jgi:hypothetical protein